MSEVEQWVIQNNPNFFVAELMKKQSQIDLEQNIKNIKQAELELLAILESERVHSEAEKQTNN